LTPSPCGISKNGAVMPGETDCKDGNCYCHTPWTGDTINKVDPLTGRCVCNKQSNLDYQCVKSSEDSFQLNCVKGLCPGFEVAKSDTCNQDPGHCYDPDNTGCICCKCPKGYIRCPDDIPATNTSLIQYCQDTGPICIKDPCQTDDVPDGHYKDGTCVCPGSGDPPLGEGIGIKSSEDSPIGVTCQDYCKGGGPCGNRGTCYLPEGTQRARCYKCVCPYTNDGDTSCTCSQTLPVCENATGECGCGHNPYPESSIKSRVGGECYCNEQCCSEKCRINPDSDQKAGVCIGKDPDPSDEKDCTPNDPDTPVQCDPSHFCPHNTSCCLVPNTNPVIYNCCPYKNGVCCDDGEHCCPETHPICDTENKVCTKKDGSDPISWNSAE